MIIRSQDKKKIININNCHLMLRDEHHICAVNSNCGDIGTYSTEEKAIKVLDMIQKAYNSIETMKVDKQAWRDNHYFEMPQDSEV